MRYEDLYDLSGEYDFEDLHTVSRGLDILDKYTKTTFDAGTFGIIYKADIKEVLNNGISVEEVKQLFKMQWHYDDKHFVKIVSHDELINKG